MPKDNESTKWLYEQLKSKGYNVGKDQAEFDNLMRNNKASREWAYKTATSAGMNVGKDQAEFDNLVAPRQQTSVPRKEPANGTQKSTEETVWKPTMKEKLAMNARLNAIGRSAQRTMDDFNTHIDNLNEYGKTLGDGHTVNSGYRFNPDSKKMERTYLTPTGERTFNKTAADEESRLYREETEAIRAEEQRRREEEAKMQHAPTLWETVKKSLGAGFLRAGAGLIDAMQSLTSGMIVENPSSPTGYMRTRSYEEALADKNAPITIASSYMHNKADKLSEEAQPHSGRKGFLDMLWDGEIGGFLQKGIATAGESLPMTLSAFNPYTMTLNAISMAGSNFRENTLENPDIPAWKRASQAIGSAAIEQAVEKYADPIFKYVGGGKILRGASKNASGKISTEITRDATETLAKRIYGRLKGLGKDALGEGVEEVMSNVGNDILGETLDIVDGNEDYGLRAQWEDLKKENPDADLWDFAQAKAKENVESFIGGAMAGAYTSGTAQLSNKALQYSFDKLGGGSVEGNEGQPLNPFNVDVAQSYDDGYSEDETAELQDTKNLYELRQGKMADMLGVDAGQVDETIGDPVNFIGELQRLGRTDEIQHVLDYVNSKAKYDGMIQRVRDDIDSRIEQSNTMIDSRVNRATGAIQGVTMKVQDDEGKDRRAYVLEGNLVMLDDGTGIDHDNSDESIVIRDAATGAIEMVSPDAILSMEQPVDPELEKQTAAEAIRQQFAGEAANRIDGVLPFNQGDTYTLTDENGQQSQIQIVPNQDGIVDNGDGTVNVSSDGGVTVVPMSKDDIQLMSDATNRARVLRSEQQREAERLEQAQPEYSLNTEVTLRDEAGNAVRGSITADMNEDGQYEVYTESPINGRKVNLFTADELNALNYEQPDGNNGGQNIPENGNIGQENIPQGNVAGYSVNEEAVNGITLDDFMKTDSSYVESYYAEHPESMATEIQEKAETTADYLNGNLSAHDYLAALGYATGEKSWLDNTTEEEIEQTVSDRVAAYMPFLNQPAATEAVQPDTTEVVSQPQEQLQQPQQSALERIPKDEQGQPVYEQTDADTAWDAIVEQSEGDEAMAQSVADSMLADKEAELKKVEKAKPKGGTTVAEKIAAERERKNAVEQAKATLAHWQKIAQTAERRRQVAMAEQARAAAETARLRREQEETERAEREEADRIRREALNGVPDIIDDKPQDARARGFRRVNGEKVDRQQPLQAKHGKEVQVKFDDKNIPAGRVSLIEAEQLQPSHVNGRRNPLHFIDEAQPKERNDEASVISARNIAANIRPEEITSSVTAYTGAPTVNARGEVIQGNNRSAALREMWAGQPEQAAKYKQYLAAHAADFGLTAEDVEAMQHPVLVNMIDVADDDAITLGQFVAQDTESGGVERIKPKNIVQKMGGNMRSYANLLLKSTDDEMSFAELVDRNGMDVLKWMQQKGYITSTQYKSAFDSKGNLTAEAKNDLKGIMYQSIFQNGNTHLEEMFGALPVKAQKAILATAYRDYDSPNAERMNMELQDSISAYYALSQMPEFANAKNYKEARIAAEAWKRQLALDDVTGESYLPSERYSNFAILLATMYKGQTQMFIQNTFRNIYDLVQGTQEETLFETPDNTPRTLVAAINEAINSVRSELLINEQFTYNNGQRRSNVLAGSSTTGQQGGQGSPGSLETGERVENGDATADRSGGTESDSGEEEIIRREEELASRVEVSDDDWQEGDAEKPTYKRSIIIDGKHTATQIDQPDEEGHYTGSYFEFDNKRFGDIAEIINYIDNGNTLSSKIAEEEAKVNVNPTEAQKEAGNYKKGHVRIGQFDVSIEQPKGSVRSGVDASGNKWETTMQNTYGYIRGTEGVDGDHIDVFLTNDIDGWNGRRVYIVDQYNEDGTFDEHKVMLGFNDEAEAQDAYLSNYEKGWEYKHKLDMSSVNLPDFEKWINSSHRKIKPFAEYKSVKMVDENRSKTDADQKHQLSDFNVGDVVRDYYNKKLYRIKKHSANGVSTIAELDDNGNENSTTTINAYNNPRYSLAESPTKQEASTPTTVSYSIEPAQYTTKRGKVLDMFLVKFSEPLTKGRQRAARELAKSEKGWYDRDKGGFMMRSEESAHNLADTITGNEEAVSDAQPLSLADTRKLEEPAMRQMDVEGLMEAIRENGEAKLSDHLIPQSEQKEETSARETESSEQGNAYGANNKLVSRDRYEELKARMRRKLGGQLNMGIDPEILAIGAEMAAYHIEAGARKFAEYATHMIADLGDAIRPYLKSFYNGARDLPEVQETGLANEMTPYEEVRTFDVANFDKGHLDVLATAEMVVQEQEANRQTDEAKEKLINKRNEQRRNEDEQTTADTETIASKAETIADEAERNIENATDEQQINEAVETIDKQIEEVNKQLALLGYYEAEPVESDFNEAYGYMRNAEKKAAKDASSLAKRLAKDLGIENDPIADNKGKQRKGYFSYSNIAPAGGEIYINLPLGNNRELEIVLQLDPDKGDNLNYMGGYMRIQNNQPQAGEQRWSSNVWLNRDDTYQSVLDRVRQQIKYHAPGFVLPAQRDASSKDKSQPKAKKINKKEVSLHIEGSLFDDLFNENATDVEQNNSNRNENEVHLQIGSGIAERERGHEPRQDEPVGTGAEAQAERPDGRGVDRRDTAYSRSDEERGRSVSRTPESQQSITEPKNTRNNHSDRGENHAPTSVDARIDANIKAIELSQQLMQSGETATPEHMKVLRKFSGWGGLGKAFSDTSTSRKLQDLLGAEGYEQAVMSANSAYYTPAYVVDTLWDIAEQMGFKGGNILEGSAGIGNILGQMPVRISERSDIQAVEIDGTSGTILSLLYPDAKVDIQGFEQTRIPNGSVDLAITNVPFVTGLRVDDTTGDKDLSKKFHNIHDFCIAKNVRKLREGGIGIFISSNGTLDNSKKLRDWIVNEGGSDFVGAFRMNNRTFGGTPVTSDIIVIRKRLNGKKSPYAIDVSTVSGERTAEYDTGETRKLKGQEVPVVKQLAMDYNRYFIEHPENMAGDMRFAFEEGDTYRPTSKGLYPAKGKDQEKMLADFVDSFAGKDWSSESVTDNTSDPRNPRGYVMDASADGKKLGEMYVKDDKLVIASAGGYYPLQVNANKVKGHTKVECFNAYSAIKTALADVLEYQTNNESDKGLKPLLDRLNKAYDDFVATYGHFNKNTAIAFLRNDVDYPNVFSLEKYEEIATPSGERKQKFGKTDVFSKRVVDKGKEPTPTNVKDGIIASMFKFGRIDVPYIVGQLGEDVEDVKHDIIENGYGFEDPLTKQMEVSYQYLSGNVREKLRQAQENNENGVYDNNIKALQDVLPMDIPAHLIDFTLGSSWVDPKLYEEYVKERTGIEVKFTAAGGTWFMKAPDYGLNVEKNRSMGVYSERFKKNILGHTLIEAAIQNKTITVSQTYRLHDGTTETEVDKEATQACSNRIDEIRQDFKEWARLKMQNDADMSARMERVYNDTFNNYVPMSIPDDFVPEYFGGASHKFKMRPHQGKAIVRGTMQPLMLAHEVGTGKTFTLISTAMEMRRLGTARKPMIVVQNATVGQFVASAKELYPNAKILTLEEADRSAEGRKNFYAKIRYNDWDMIVVPQSTFDFIPDSEERQMSFIQDKIEEKMLVLEQMKDADPDGKSMITRQAEREIEDLQDQLAELTGETSKKRSASNQKKRAVALQNAEVKAKEMLDRATDDVENFDDMGIDALLIDEAHEYKHLGFATAMQRGVKGVDPSYSKKSQGVFLKVQSVLEKNNGRNVIFATGTPISNTAAEIWTFMRYLMPADTMKEYGIYYFDDFVRNFGNIQQMLEFSTNGKYKENNRFAGYVNLPELVRIWLGVADIVRTRDAGGVNDKIPEMEGGKAQDIYLPQTRALRSIMNFVKSELEKFENMSGKEKKANSHIPLTMFGIAKAAAVDARLVQADAEDDPRSKTNEAVRQTLRSLKETADYKGTVAIFADNYQNKQSGFNLYEDIRNKLIAAGVPSEQIVVMRSGMTVKKKLEIFDKVNRGDVRVILGSTFTLGTGVNIQERLHTLIHLDAPNRPMDYTQRNGRILRQGNLHRVMGKPVRVLRFGVEDSLDVTAYQRLKTKGAIADSIMNGKQFIADSMSNRVLEEDEDVFGDVVAQLSGSEYALLKNNAEKNVRKYESRKKQWEADQTYIHNAKPKLKALIEQSETRAKEQQKYLDAVKKSFPNGTFESITIGKQTFKSVDAMADFIKGYNKTILDASKKMKEGGNTAEETHNLSVSLGDYTFKVKTVLSRETARGGGQLFSEIHRNMTYSCPELGLTDVPVHQSLLRNAIDDIVTNVITGKDFAERVDAAERSAEHNRSELEQLQLRENKPFEYEDELKQAHEKLKEYSELMKKEMAEKEAKYAEMDASVDVVENITNIDDDDVLYRIDNFTTNEEEANDLFRVVDDESEIERLNSEPTIKVYRAMSLVDGKLYPPMSKKIGTGSNRISQAPSEFGQWEVSDERPQLVEKEGSHKNHIYIVKDNGKGLWVAYNPYFHTSRNPLNDQFAEAYQRPNLVTVEVEVPESELTSGYQAAGAKDPVGETKWNAGPVNRQLSGDKKRKVILSRWMRPVRIVPDSEVAERIAGLIDGENVAIPDNTVTPSLLSELKKLGVKIVDGINKGRKNSPVVQRTGEGTLTDDELSIANDPVAKLTGKSTRTSRQRREFAERERERMAGRVQELAEKLHLDNVDIVTDASMLNGRRARAKGFYSRSTGRITIVIPNHSNIFDVEQTLLHEAVAHYGLRQLFGEHFDTFLWNVYENADIEVRQRITELASRNGWDYPTATEEYLASLAENTNFENINASWWSKIKELFLRMLHKIGFENFSGVTLSDNELRYILWRSYENLKEPGRYRSILGEAADVAKQHELKVGNYAENSLIKTRRVAEVNVDDIENVNRKFNEELEGLTEENKDSVTLSLGRPSPILRAAGVEDKPMKLYGNKVIKKMKKHGFKLEELRNLPEAVANPITVFKNYGKDGNRSILTELKTEQGNFLVTLTLGEGHDVDFNVVTSVFGKGESNIIDWIKRGFTTYINKEKALNYLHHSALKAVTSSNQELSSAANIVKNFENPNISEENLLYRDGDPEVHERAFARRRYEERVKRGMFQTQEALQDSMLGLREAMDAILKGEGKKKVYIEDVDGFENAYLGENRLSSVNKAEADAFAHLLFKPLLDEVVKLAPNDDARTMLIDYMMAKHGLERNKIMAERDAQRDYEATQQAHPHSKKTLQDFIDKYRKKDYAGLTALTGTDNVADAESEALMMVNDYEAAYDTADLWKRTKDVSNAILSKLYETGMMSKNTYDNVRSMYEYYIPLRGFDEKTSDEAYAYLNSKNSAFNAPIKTARGRKSKANDPFAYLQSMAESAIAQGNRNKLVKQKFLNFVLNHPSDLASVSDIWLKYEKVTDEWKPVFPDNINADDTPEEVERKMQDFEDKMKELAGKEPDMYKHGKDTVNIPYRIVEKRDMRQHQVVVKRAGRDYVITINGNPRAAQALNGQTNPDNDISGAIGAILKAGERINRELSALYTTRNPDFVVSNFIRDMLYSNSMMWIKESPNYALRYHRNFAKVNPARMKILLAKYRKGTLDMSNDTERMFQQFMMNGGETGYANMRDIEKHKNDIRREIRKSGGQLPIRKAWDLLSERFDELNRAVENCARFAAFITSREMGRTIDRSIYDAKEISVNFNKKGSGAKFMGTTGQTALGNASAIMSGLGRSGFVFWNAAIQGTTNFGRQLKRHPAKALSGLAAIYLLGAVVASLGYGDDGDDDKNSYWNLPEYVRRSNILFRTGDQWISIPLPVEYRALYGLGELMISAMSGKEHLSDGELANAIAGQVSQILPLDILEGGGGMKAFIPSSIKPFAEAYGYNKSWTGLPIYKDTPYNKDMPEWTKAYKSANKYLVDLSEVLNEATGGDKYTKGNIDINPAKVEYVLTGYFGGVANTIDRLMKMGETIIGQREYDPKSFLILNRIIKNGDERTEYKAVNNEYFRLKEEHDKFKTRLRHYESDTNNGVFDYAEKIDFLYNSPEYERYEIFENYRPSIDEMYDILKEITDDDERKSIEADLNELKKMMISDMNEIRNRK